MLTIGPTEDFLEWAASNAVIFDDFDGETADIETLSFLDERLQGKRVAFLGEMDHFVHEKYDYRLFLIRYLVSRGFRVLCEELSWTDGVHTDRYLSSGDPSHLDRLATYGYKGDIRTDRDDSATGILRNDDTYPLAELSAEQKRFNEALLRLNAQQPRNSQIRYFGLDVDYTPGGAYRDLDSSLKPIAGDPIADELRGILALTPNESIHQETDRLSRALRFTEARADHFMRVLGRRSYATMVHTSEVLKDSFAYISVANPAQDYTELNEAMAMRESIMHRNAAFVLEQMGPNERIVLMAHALHLAKDDDLIQTPSTGAGPGGGRVPSIGHYINQTLAPDEVFSFWMLFGHGRDLQPFPNLPRKLSSKRGSLNHLMNQVGSGSSYLIPVVDDDPKARLFAQEIDVMHMYNHAFRTIVSKQADAILFTPKVSPLRL